MTEPPLHRFKDKTLAQTALTHRSFGVPNNQRLEWLGDTLLQYHVSLMIYESFGNLAESGLTAVRTELVNNGTLAQLARHIGLPPHLRLGNSEKKGHDKNSILADAMEAYIAAIYLDGGDISAVLEELLGDKLADLAKAVQRDGVHALRDAKSRLQEYLQQKGLPPPAYELIRTEGKAHNSTFTVQCQATDACRMPGRGASRAAAEQQAAAACLKELD